jgi:hypothetical protein
MAGAHGFHRQLAKTVVQGEPAVDRARGRDRQRTIRRNLRVAVLLEPGEAQAFRRAARSVVAVKLPGFRIPHDRKQVATHAVAGRLHQAQRRVCRNRRVDCGPAALEDVESDLGGQRLRSRDHAVLGEYFRARRERATGNAIRSEDAARRQRGDQGKAEAEHDSSRQIGWAKHTRSARSG